MKNRKYDTLLRLLALAMVFALVLPTGTTTAFAASSTLPVLAQPRASAYLCSYGADVYAAGGGEVHIYFNVTGTDYMDVLGYFSITLYESTDDENWEPVENFHWTDYPDMLGYNHYFHGGSVVYEGVAGRYYMALASVYAGKGEGGDTREFYSLSTQAT